MVLSLMFRSALPELQSLAPQWHRLGLHFSEVLFFFFSQKWTSSSGFLQQRELCKAMDKES